MVSVAQTPVPDVCEYSGRSRATLSWSTSKYGRDLFALGAVGCCKTSVACHSERSEESRSEYNQLLANRPGTIEPLVELRRGLSLPSYPPQQCFNPLKIGNILRRDYEDPLRLRSLVNTLKIVVAGQEMQLWIAQVNQLLSIKQIVLVLFHVVV